MERRKTIGILIVLLFIKSKFYIDAAGVNSGKDPTNEKDLKEIAIKMEEGLGSMKKAWEQINAMKTEQHTFEIDLRNMLENNPKAPADMKAMLEDQKAMHEQVTNIQMNVKEFQDNFSNWIEEIKKLQANPTDMATYEALKPFIRELDALADQLKTVPQKFISQAKRYKEFGQSMLDSESIDAAVNKRLCALGTKIEDLGYQVSDTGDPITMTSERVTNIWKRTNPRDKDNVLPKITKNLTPKGNAIVSDGDSQASSGAELKKMCKKIAEKVKSQPQPPESQGNSEACKEDVDGIGKALGELSLEGSDLDKLRENLEVIANLETEFESLAKLVPDPGKISKQLNILAVGVSNIKHLLVAATDKAKGVKSCDGKIIEGLGNNIHGVYSLLLGAAQKLELTAATLSVNGKNLVDQTEFDEELKAKYDLVGEKVKSVGTLLLDSIILPKIEDIGQRFANIGKSLGGDSGNTFVAIGNIVKVVVEALKGHLKKIVDSGTEISSLQATRKKIPEIETNTEKSGSETNTEKSESETNTEKSESETNTEKSESETNTEKPESETGKKKFGKEKIKEKFGIKKPFAKDPSFMLLDGFM